MADEITEAHAADARAVDGRAALRRFIADLCDAFEAAGPPTYQRLETLSKWRANEPAGGPVERPRVLVLAHSTTHDYLNGKRDMLPPWPWVASFLIVLRDAAVENSLDPAAIGTPADWHDKYRAVRAALNTARRQERQGGQPLPAPVPADPAVPAPPGPALSRPASSPGPDSDKASTNPGPAKKDPSEHAPRPTPSGPDAPSCPPHHSAPDTTAAPPTSPPPADEPGPATARQPPHSAPTGHLRTRAGLLTASAIAPAGTDQLSQLDRPTADVQATDPPPEPTIQRRRYIETYGRTGMRLLRHAEADEGKAEGIPAYRLAVLLACDDRPAEAVYWLRRAAHAGHTDARRLADDWDPHNTTAPPYYWQATDAAYQVGLDYERKGQPFAAAVFYHRAALNGHTDAAYRYGLHLHGIGKPRLAEPWLNRAAVNGHPQATQPPTLPHGTPALEPTTPDQPHPSP